MKTPRIPILLLLAAGILRAQTPAETAAQPAASPAAPAKADMQKWLSDLDTQWQPVFKRDVTDVRNAEHDRLKLHYLNSIEAAVAKASSAGDLNVAVALRGEEKRLSESNEVPAQDDAGILPVLKQVRAGWRAQMERLDKDRAARAKALHARYDQILSQAQTQLTQRQRFDDALLVKSRREEIAAAWLAGTPLPVRQPPPTVPVKPTTPAKATGWRSLATKREDFRDPSTITVLPDGWMRATKRASVKTPEGRDMAIRARMRFAPSPKNWLIIRDDGKENNYYSPIKSDGTAVTISRGTKTDGQFKSARLGEYPLPRVLAPGDEYTLELRAVGDEISVFFDGKSLGGVHDSAHREGHAHFYTEGTEFRDIEWSDLTGGAK